jgi:hypothetical protein
MSILHFKDGSKQNFIPNMYEDTKIETINPVFNMYINEETNSKIKQCIICLEDIVSPEFIQPCKTCCNIYMHNECFIKYSLSKQNKPICVTCYNELNLLNIDIKLDVLNIPNTDQIIDGYLYSTMVKNLACICNIFCIVIIFFIIYFYTI